MSTPAVLSRHDFHLSLPPYLAAAHAGRPLSLLLLAVASLTDWRQRLTPLACDGLLAHLEKLVLRRAPENALVGAWQYGQLALLLPDCPLWQGEELGLSLERDWADQPLPPALALHKLPLALDMGSACLPPAEGFELLRQAEAELLRRRGGSFGRLLRDGSSLLPQRELYLPLVSSYLAHHDPYLQRHGQMTAGFCRQAGAALGWSEEDLQQLELAAAFADLCMVETAGAALHKPGSLTAAEMARIQKHPRLAAETAARLNMPPAVVRAVAGHHERVDGAGYPAGLSGEEIARPASLLGCCSAYAAMLLPRPYRPALRPYRAKAEIAAAAGRQWPADIVRAVYIL